MKLLTRTYLHFVWIGLLVFLAGGWIFYIRMENILNEETQEKLEAQSEVISRFVAEKKLLPPADLLTGFPQFRESHAQKPSWADTLLYRPDEGETLPYRIYQFPVELEGKKYLAVIGMSLFEQDDLLETVSYSFIMLFGLFLVVLILSSFLLTRNTWKPFLALIQLMDQYRPGLGVPENKIRTRISEFNSLKQQVLHFMQRSEQEYDRLRAFSENAAHELQTPLAVLQSKTEQLMQSPGLDQNQLGELASFQEQLSRLRKINQTLLLLTRIDHGLYKEVLQIRADLVIQRQLKELEELFAMKHISLQTHMSECLFLMNEQLIEILVSNLLNNALKFTPENGKVSIYAERNVLRFENQGVPLRKPEAVFERFYKDDSSSDSTGLGLSLVQSIADQSGLKVSYSSRENGTIHVFEISRNASTELL